ncbi:phage tail-like protein [Chitinivorax tropicus]|uniref:Phage tail-like protein n=1 Tax=Chitinivorax tropicus TaxID=714531 RepID=A0A840MIW5_9PROT|nr:phage tail protein [Chitinivorax tropicus]MBB5019144.1 phage tail-like protein [Chitinivorax tropicus]
MAARTYPEADFAMITGAATWLRCSFQQAALIDGIVQLGWSGDATPGEPGAISDPQGAGLAFDRHCRLFHSLPAAQRVERVLWGAFDPLHPQRVLPTAEVLGSVSPHQHGDFAPRTPLLPGFTPRALACDERDHLFVLDTAGQRVVVFDLIQQRVVLSLPVPGGAVDLAYHQGWVYGLSPQPPQLWKLSANRGMRLLPVSLVGVDAPARLAFSHDGRLFVLGRAHTVDASLHELGRPRQWRASPLAITLGSGKPLAWASDIVAIGHDDRTRLVIARRPNEDLLQLDIGGVPYGLVEPLQARGYDGMGIVAAPDGRIAYWTDKGVRHAVAARVKYQSPGRVISFRLDSGSYQTVWGRVLLDACLPPNTEIRVQGIVGDDDEDVEDRIGRDPPVSSMPVVPLEAEATPMPQQIDVPDPASLGGPVIRRSDGSEQPWLQADDQFATYEAAVPAKAGRYLWLVIDLIGTSRATPKIRTIRAEHPGHDWLRRLPKLYARHEAMRGFLQRFLTAPAGLHHDLASQHEHRHALLKPFSTPASILPWLAGWLGLSLDERWSDTARRTFIAEAMLLWRLRGTVWGIRRMLQIVTDRQIVIMEQFRTRGLGVVAGDGLGGQRAAVLGHGLRVGGPVGEAARSGDASVAVDSFRQHAHRFSVLILGELSPEQEAMVRHLLEQHRPAHTLYELCTIGAGMRIGRNLRVAMTSVIGHSGGFQPMQLGHSALGKDNLLGRPGSGLSLGNQTLGQGRLT